MALSSTAIADKVKLVLQDLSNARWTADELIKWINSACKEIVVLKPSALTVNVAMQLANGSKQNIVGASFKNTVSGATMVVTPLQFIAGVRNLGTTGTEANAGMAVTAYDRKILDVAMPDWHSAENQLGAIRYCLLDPKDPKVFYVYPKAASTMYLEVVISRAPTAITALGSNDIDAGFDEVYESALVDYVLYRAFSGEADIPASQQRSQNHYAAFATALGVRLRNEVVMAPKKQFSPVEVVQDGVPQ